MRTSIACKEGEPGYDSGGTKAVSLSPYIILGVVTSVRKYLRVPY